jgi:ABC-type spermidine/putrescine transport system permease subunit II
MKIVRRVLWTCALLGSLVLPIFFLTVRHFHLEDETAHWLVSMWPRSQGSVALEDRRAIADMVVTYGEVAAANMLMYTAIGWGGALIYSRIFKRVAKDPGF